MTQRNLTAIIKRRAGISKQQIYTKLGRKTLTVKEKNARLELIKITRIKAGVF